MVAAVRDADKARTVFKDLGITEGRQAEAGRGILFLEANVDVTNAETLRKDVFAGVQQVVCALGAVFGRSADGQMGYLDGMTPAKIDAEGVSNVAAAAAKYLAKVRREIKDVLPFRTAEDLATWQRLDDVIMGGQSDSALELSADGSGATWKGRLVVEGGGFCGARTLPLQMDLSAFDGVALRVRSDGRTLKLNIKTDTFSEPEDTYQATFETAEGGDWTNVFIPWHEFVPVKRARSVPNGPPLDASKIRQFGLVYSRFAFNGFPNDAYTPGPFEIQFEGGIRAYKAPRPQLILVSSAGVERNARIGDDLEARKKDIPIVQLNPGGVLNHKYTGEAAVRASGLSYAVIRPTGMSDDAGAEGPALLEASQGDRISGKVARSDVAAVVAAAAGLPAAAGKTFEIRRQQAADAQGRAMTPVDYLRMMLSIQRDAVRTKAGIEPFPTPAPPPPPPTEERKQEILADPRVQQAQARNAGGRVRGGEEAAEAKSVVPVDVASQQGRAEDGAKEGSQEEAVPENVVEVREWIRLWRAKTLEKQLPAEAAANRSQ